MMRTLSQSTMSPMPARWSRSETAVPAAPDQAVDPFVTAKEQGKGTGLGLATVYGIVKQHDGHVSIASEVGEGTTVTAYFPAAKGVAKAGGPRRSRKAPAGRGQTIVLAEDDDGVRGVVREILEKNGYSVLSFGDPIECVTEMERRGGSVDLLLTDVVMPRMNGRQLFERMARKFPELSVIYMSGFDQGIITDRGGLGPGVDLIRKPVSVPSLLQKIHDQLAPADELSSLKAR